MQPSEFVKNMTALWKKPNDTADANIAAGQYCEALAKFTPAQLAAGWTKLRDEHDRTAWPLISECRKAVMSASSVNNSTPIRNKWEDYEDFANGCMRDKLAIRARDEGWLLGLWDYCRINGRMPWAQDIGKLREDARLANEAATSLDRANKLHCSLFHIWECMRAREARLSKLVPEVAA